MTKLEVFTDTTMTHHQSLIRGNGVWQCLDCGWWTKGDWTALNSKPCIDDGGISTLAREVS